MLGYDCYPHNTTLSDPTIKLEVLVVREEHIWGIHNDCLKRLHQLWWVGLVQRTIKIEWDRNGEQQMIKEKPLGCKEVGERKGIRILVRFWIA
jgi:hypothetical protein